MVRRLGVSTKEKSTKTWLYASKRWPLPLKKRTCLDIDILIEGYFRYITNYNRKRYYVSINSYCILANFGFAKDKVESTVEY